MSAKENKELTKAIEEKQTIKKENTFNKNKVFYILSSKANYTIEILHDNKKLYIPPFGKVKVIKEAVKYDKKDAKYLTFIKL